MTFNFSNYFLFNYFLNFKTLRSNTDVFQEFFPPKSPVFNKSSHTVNDVVGKYPALFNSCHLN